MIGQTVGVETSIARPLGPWGFAGNYEDGSVFLANYVLSCGLKKTFQVYVMDVLSQFRQKRPLGYLRTVKEYGGPDTLKLKT